MNKTKEAAMAWIEEGKPCVYRHGWEWKGAKARSISKEQALKLFHQYSFGMGFYELNWIKDNNGNTILEFNELSAHDME